MKHSVRCERAKGPLCRCRCGGSMHSTAHTMYITPPGTTTPVSGKYICIPMGGKVADVIYQFYNRKFTLPCSHSLRIHEFVGHPDGIGYPDRENTRWQIYVKCPKCRRVWPTWQIGINHAIRSIPESDRVRFALESYMKELEEMWPAKDVPQFEIQKEEECFLLIDRECYITRIDDTEITVCGEVVTVLGNCLDGVTGHKHRIEKSKSKEKGDYADVFKIERIQ